MTDAKKTEYEPVIGFGVEVISAQTLGGTRGFLWKVSDRDDGETVMSGCAKTPEGARQMAVEQVETLAWCMSDGELELAVRNPGAS